MSLPNEFQDHQTKETAENLAGIYKSQYDVIMNAFAKGDFSGARRMIESARINWRVPGQYRWEYMELVKKMDELEAEGKKEGTKQVAGEPLKAADKPYQLSKLRYSFGQEEEAADGASGAAGKDKKGSDPAADVDTATKEAGTEEGGIEGDKEVTTSKVAEGLEKET